MAPTRASDPRDRGTRALLLLAALPAAACHSERDAIANLDALYASRTGEHALYAKEVPKQGFFAGKDSKEEIDDPVEFAIENLQELREAGPKSLDALERTRALGVACEMGRLDPSRIVRKFAYDTALVLWHSLPDRKFRFESRAVDEAALNVELDALIVLASAPPERQAPLLDERAAEIARGTAALEAVAPDRFELAHKLLLLAAKCGRIASTAEDEKEVEAALTAAAESLAGHVAFLAARPDFSSGRGVVDPSPEVQASAGRLLIAIDPVAATADLGEVYPRTQEALVRIAWLEALVEAPMRAPAVNGKLREPIALDLEYGDASIEFWAKHAMAHLLGADPDATSDAELRARWDALGEWDPQART